VILANRPGGATSGTSSCRQFHRKAVKAPTNAVIQLSACDNAEFPAKKL